MKYFNTLFGLSVLLFLAACTPIPKLTEGPIGTEQSSSSSTVVILQPKQHITGVNIEWLSPSPAEVSVSEIGGKVEIKIRITSAMPINPEQIDIYVNGVIIGNKADEVSLLKRPEFKDQILVMQVPVLQGSNAVQVVVTKDADQRYFAERVLVKDAQGVRIKPAPVSGNTRITWVEPDAISLGGEMYTTKTRELTIRLNVTSPDNLKKGDFQLLHNKKYLNPSGSASLIGQNGNYVFKDVIIMEEETNLNEISLRIATSTGYAESENVKINYSPLRPNVYLLSIGTQLNLKYAYKDARDFAMLYAVQNQRTYKLFSSIKIDTLIGAAAVTSEIRGMIETIRNKLHTGQVAEDDIVILFISSHGFIDDHGDFRIQGSDYAPERKYSTSVSYKTDILAHLEELPCKKLILIDACHSGGARANAADILAAIHNIRQAPRGFAILTSSSKDEESYEDVKWQNGAFTEGILKGLKEGLADGDHNGIISLLELETYVKQEVPSMVNTLKSKPQHPLLSRNDIGDLPIFIVQ